MISSFLSHAKINLGLKILNKRKDNYHNLHSLLIELALSDELIFSPAIDFKLSADSANNIQFPLDNTNLISRAYELMRQESGSVSSEYAVHINKVIPLGSGLGGGSSNAAFTLKQLN